MVVPDASGDNASCIVAVSNSKRWICWKLIRALFLLMFDALHRVLLGDCISPKCYWCMGTQVSLRLHVLVIAFSDRALLHKYGLTKGMTSCGKCCGIHKYEVGITCLLSRSLAELSIRSTASQWLQLFEVNWSDFKHVLNSTCLLFRPLAGLNIECMSWYRKCWFATVGVRDHGPSGFHRPWPLQCCA